MAPCPQTRARSAGRDEFGFLSRGTDAFLTGSRRQGLGLGDDEFSPIDVPSLKHLWTNLATQRGAEPDGYTLKIGCSWGTTDEKHSSSVCPSPTIASS